MTDRILRINALIAHHVSEIIARDIALRPGVFVTLSKVETSRDLRHTTIHVGVFPDDAVAYAMATLDHERGAIRKALSARMPTKILPRIAFRHDDTEAKAQTVERIFRDIADNG